MTHAPAHLPWVVVSSLHVPVCHAAELLCIDHTMIVLYEMLIENADTHCPSTDRGIAIQCKGGRTHSDLQPMDQEPGALPLRHTHSLARATCSHGFAFPSADVSFKLESDSILSSVFTLCDFVLRSSVAILFISHPSFISLIAHRSLSLSSLAFRVAALSLLLRSNAVASLHRCVLFTLGLRQAEICEFLGSDFANSVLRVSVNEVSSWHCGR